MDHRKHNPDLVFLKIWHARMPQPQISHHNTTFLHNRLARRLNLPPLFQHIRLDSPARTLAMVTLLAILGRNGMRPEPELGGAVLRRHGREWDCKDL